MSEPTALSLPAVFVAQSDLRPPADAVRRDAVALAAVIVADGEPPPGYPYVEIGMIVFSMTDGT